MYSSYVATHVLNHRITQASNILVHCLQSQQVQKSIRIARNRIKLTSKNCHVMNNTGKYMNAQLKLLEQILLNYILPCTIIMYIHDD